MDTCYSALVEQASEQSSAEPLDALLQDCQRPYYELRLAA